MGMPLWGFHSLMVRSFAGVAGGCDERCTELGLGLGFGLGWGETGSTAVCSAELQTPCVRVCAAAHERRVSLALSELKRACHGM